MIYSLASFDFQQKKTPKGARTQCVQDQNSATTILGLGDCVTKNTNQQNQTALKRMVHF
jgi:hypothetical protein